MKKLYQIILFTNISLLSSCVASLYPITENDNAFVYLKNLPGRWVDNESKDEYIVKPVTGNIYSIREISKKNDESSKGDTGYYRAIVVNILGEYIMHCTLDPGRMGLATGGEATKYGLLISHLIFHLKLKGKDSILISTINRIR